MCQAFRLHHSEPPLGLVMDVVIMWKDSAYRCLGAQEHMARATLPVLSAWLSFWPFNRVGCPVVLFKSLRAGVAQGEFLDAYAGLCRPELWALPLFQVFRYSTTLEKHKLFISGLPFSCTKEELEDICKAHGTVKDLRLVTNRAGKPKVSGAQADFGSLLRSGPVRSFW